MKSIYLIGSLRNKMIPTVANSLENLGFDVFDDWFSPGPEADDWWRTYENSRGRTYGDALKGHAATHIYEFDKHHIDRCDIAVLSMPAGKSGHLELGYMLGQGKPGFIVFDEEPERWDVMYKFATGIFFKPEDLHDELRKPEYHDAGT
jgi:nucleoside 2-deoxyribosyltransferase